MQILLWPNKSTLLWPCLSPRPLFELVFTLILCSSATLASSLCLEHVRFFPIFASAPFNQKSLPPRLCKACSHSSQVCAQISPLQRGLSWPLTSHCPATLYPLTLLAFKIVLINPDILAYIYLCMSISPQKNANILLARTFLPYSY